MRIGWLSDIHLNFLEPSAREAFLAEVAACRADAWLIGGDIGEAASVEALLRQFEASVPGVAYFVLGNHDFYCSSIIEIRHRIRELVGQTDRLVWLTAIGHQVLEPGVALVGDDCWGDARLGNPLTTEVLLNDFFLIEELADLSREALVDTLEGMGTMSAARIGPKLDQAARGCQRVIFLTHVPPFEGAAWYGGRTSNADWLPWMTCHAAGEAILACASAHPETEFLVLCGHTHGSGRYNPAPNVTALTAEAVYGEPQVQRVFDTADADWPHS